MHLRIGTRGSPLALAQVDIFIDSLSKVCTFTHEVIIIKTTGDKILDKPLYDIGGKALFIKELESALLDGQIDIAIHSLKDVPGDVGFSVIQSESEMVALNQASFRAAPSVGGVESSVIQSRPVSGRRGIQQIIYNSKSYSSLAFFMSSLEWLRHKLCAGFHAADFAAALNDGSASLQLGCYLQREYPLDCLVSYKAKSILELPKNSKVGSSSPRRAVFLKKQRPDLEIFPLRGNVNSRLKKLSDGEYDAIILAEAGLRRLGLYNEDYCYVIKPEEMIPAVGQGVITAQYVSSNQEIKDILKLVDDPVTRNYVDIERDFLSELNADCRTPVAGFVLGNRAMFMLADDDMSNVKILEKSFDSVGELDGRKIALEIARI